MRSSRFRFRSTIRALILQSVISWSISYPSIQWYPWPYHWIDDHDLNQVSFLCLISGPGIFSQFIQFIFQQPEKRREHEIEVEIFSPQNVPISWMIVADWLWSRTHLWKHFLVENHLDYVYYVWVLVRRLYVLGVFGITTKSKKSRIDRSK